MSNPIIVDTSPLIILAKAGWLDLLRLAGSPVYVPHAVMDEIEHGDPNDPVAVAVRQKPWLIALESALIDPRLQAFQLGSGEEAVLSEAIGQPGMEAILDDLAARRCAQSLGVPCRGCLSLVLLAKQHGVIVAARPVVESLRSMGLRLSDRVMNQALAIVGE